MLTVIGKVISGAGRGRRIGYPTVNVLTDSDLDLPYGVYAGRACIKKVWHPAAIFWGKAETFDVVKPTLEIYLLNFTSAVARDIKVQIEFCRKLREIKKFARVEELVKAIRADIQKLTSNLM